MSERPDRVVALGAEVDDLPARITFEAGVGSTELAADRAASAAGAVPRKQGEMGGARLGA